MSSQLALGLAAAGGLLWWALSKAHSEPCQRSSMNQYPSSSSSSSHSSHSSTTYPSAGGDNSSSYANGFAPYDGGSSSYHHGRNGGYGGGQASDHYNNDEFDGLSNNRSSYNGSGGRYSSDGSAGSGVATAACTTVDHQKKGQQAVRAANAAIKERQRQAKRQKKKARTKHARQLMRLLDREPPFEGAAGRWVAREEFSGKKSFGWYWCSECQRTWMSAHAWREYEEDCQGCEQPAFAEIMWQNAYGDSRTDEQRAAASEKPHDQRRCHKCCQLGYGCWLLNKSLRDQRKGEWH